MRCRWCVGFACEVDARMRHPQHRDPGGHGHRQLRTPHRVHGQGDSPGRSRAGQRRGLFRCRGPAPGADRGSGDRFLRGRRVGAPAAEFQEPTVSQRPGQPLRLGGPEPHGTHLYRGDGPVRVRHLRRSGAGRSDRHLRLQPWQPRLGRRRHAGQRVHPPAIPVSLRRCRRTSRAGARPTRSASATPTSGPSS